MEQLGRGFINKWVPTTHDIGEFKLLQHVPSLIRGDKKYALLPRSIFDFPDHGSPLRLTLRVLGDTPSMRSLASLAKNRWDLQGQFHIVRFRGQTFTITFKQIADYLKCNGMS